MERNDKNYAQRGMHEGRPGNIDPDDNSYVDPAKAIKAVEKLDINQSGFGRDQGQTPADEHIEDFSQIEDIVVNFQSDSMEQTLAKEFDTEDFRRTDERDNGDSTENWDAEKSRTGRNK